MSVQAITPTLCSFRKSRGKGMKLSRVIVAGIILAARVRLKATELPELPGPGLDLPVDLDGDGESSFSDIYVFNLWLAMGGNLKVNLKVALDAAVATKNDKITDLSSFFRSEKAALSKDAAVLLTSPSQTATPPPQAAAVTACTTRATLVAPFNLGTVSIAYCDTINGTTFFDGAAGHAIRTTTGDLYVARNSDKLVNGVINGGFPKTGVMLVSEGSQREASF